MKTYKIFSNNYNRNTGLGKQTTSLIDQLGYECHLKGLYKSLSIIRNRNIFNIFYFIFSSFYSSYNKQKIISMSVVSPLNSHAVHFSSCHFYALKNVYKYFYLRFFLNPFNIFYSLLEFLHYKNKNSINIFLSNIEQVRFKKVYGESKAIGIVIRPRLIDEYYNPNQNNFILGKKFLMVSHNFKLKGGEIINNLAIMNPESLFFIIGNSKGSATIENIIKLGNQDVSSFSFEKYNSFIYPSKLDSHSFALEEALVNGLIPLSSINVGFAEFLRQYYLIDKFLVNKSNNWNQFFKKFLTLDQKNFDSLKKELFRARKDWLERNIKQEYIDKKVIY